MSRMIQPGNKGKGYYCEVHTCTNCDGKQAVGGMDVFGVKIFKPGQEILAKGEVDTRMPERIAPMFRCAFCCVIQDAVGFPKALCELLPLEENFNKGLRGRFPPP